MTDARRSPSWKPSRDRTAFGVAGGVPRTSTSTLPPAWARKEAARRRRPSRLVAERSAVPGSNWRSAGPGVRAPVAAVTPSGSSRPEPRNVPRNGGIAPTNLRGLSGGGDAHSAPCNTLSPSRADDWPFGLFGGTAGSLRPLLPSTGAGGATSSVRSLSRSALRLSRTASGVSSLGGGGMSRRAG